MASLKIVSDRLSDNSIALKVVLPPRRNGEVNFAALEAINRSLLLVSLDAYDPDPRPLTAPEIASADNHTADGGGIVLDTDLSPEVRAAMLRSCPTGNCDD